MSDLLSAAERAEVRAALVDVADTFYKTVVTVYKYTTNNKLFKEEFTDATTTTYNINSMVEYGNMDTGTFVVEQPPTTSGKTDRSWIRVTMNVDILNTTHSLWDAVNNRVLLNEGKDRMAIGGVEYDITQISYDGPLEAKPVLVTIYAMPKARRA